MNNFVKLALALALILLSIWFQDLLEKEPELVIPEKHRFADYYLQDFEISSHNKQGKINYQIRAQRLEHYADEALSEIGELQIRVTSVDSRWDIRADRGVIIDNSDHIQLYDNVLVTRPADTPQGPLKMETDYIDLDTAEETLSSDRFVVVTTDQFEMKTIGMRLDNKTGILKLHSDVKGTYVK